MSDGTGYVFDPSFLKHWADRHPERPERLAAVVEALKRSGLLDEMVAIPARAASEGELATCHTAAHIARVRRACEVAPVFLDPDTYVNEHSWTAATRAAGGTIELALAVARGELRNGLALGRPPGHHAMRGLAMGFCLFNNLALAARAVLAGGSLERLAIVDFDVHHGNGTQDIFDDEPAILFVSTHQYPHFPGTGRFDEIGRGAGEGTILNIPLPAGVGDVGYRRIYEEVVFPALRRFAPEMILVSAGFDGHWRDSLAGMRLSLAGYDGICRGIAECAGEMCGSRLVVVLEGGYDLEVVAHGVTGVARALLGRAAAPDPIGPASSGEADVEAIVARVQERFA